MLKNQLNITEGAVASLREMNNIQGADLRTVRDSLATTDAQVENLKKEMADQPKVAFTAGLSPTGYLYSEDSEMTVVQYSVKSSPMLDRLTAMLQVASQLQ